MKKVTNFFTCVSPVFCWNWSVIFENNKNQNRNKLLQKLKSIRIIFVVFFQDVVKFFRRKELLQLRIEFSRRSIDLTMKKFWDKNQHFYVSFLV